MDVESEQLVAELERMLERAAGDGVPPAPEPLEDWAARHGLGRALPATRWWPEDPDPR